MGAKIEQLATDIKELEFEFQTLQENVPSKYDVKEYDAYGKKDKELKNDIKSADIKKEALISAKAK